jgi:Ca2+-binding EF-hand superfamily protein
MPEEERFCDLVFQVFDTDSNGYIDFGEFLIAFWIRSRGSLKDKLGWLFDLYDVDRSGFITPWELSKTLKFVFGMKNIKDDPYLKACDIVKQIDRNSDSKLTKQEFIYGLTINEELRNLLAPY